MQPGYMNARYYVPNTNRWLSPDSIVPDPTNPQSFNRYSYVRNNPVNFTDPTGHRECGGPFDPACAEEPLTPFEPPPRTYVGEDLAQIIFDDMADETDIPFAFPADGCYARSQQMIQRIIERYNINPESIQQVYINGLDTEAGGLFIQTDFVYPDTSEYPRWVNHDENVAWGWHVAPLIVVVTDNGGVGMVFDPSLLTDAPATINDWAAIMNNPDATITIVDRYWYTPVQTNVDESERL